MSECQIKSLDVRARSLVALGERIHSGLPASKVSKFLQASGWNKSQLFEWTHIPAANGNRRFRRGKFGDHESERIARLASLFDSALEMLRHRVRAAEWLQQPNPRLGGVAPVQAAGTELGANEVQALIGRLRHGVY